MASSPAVPDRPLRVLWLVKGLGPGGAEQLIVHHAKAIDPDRTDASAAYLVPWKDHHVDTLRDRGVDVTCLRAPRELDPRWVLRLRGLLLRGRFDVIHTHSPLVAAVVRVVARTVRPRPRLVSTEHNRWPRHARSTRLANRLTFRLDDAHLAVSEDVRDTIPEHLRAEVEALVHGTDLVAAREAAADREKRRDELGAGPDDVVVGIVANFRTEKAYDVFLAAATAAIARTPRLRFVSVGQGPLEDAMRAELARLAPDDAGDRIQLLGYRSDALSVMSAFDVFTLTSTHEGLPVSLMDALGLGLPVVATAVGGIPQAVTDGVEGILVPVGDAAALADAYVAIAGDDARRAAMSEAAAARGSEFDVVVATRRIEDLYAEMTLRR